MIRFLLFISVFGLSFLKQKENNYNNDSKKINTKPVVIVKPDLNDTLISQKLGGIHKATWYNMHGHKTASGERFHKDSLTAAYNFSKLGSYLKVTNVTSGLTVIVKVNDRMGIKNKNHIDLSKCAFDSIANPNSGRINVIVEKIR